ncbi:hypothetical protein GEMRC1_010728 [Eukaryota sp. GEM-RC1]
MPPHQPILPLNLSSARKDSRQFLAKNCRKRLCIPHRKVGEGRDKLQSPYLTSKRRCPSSIKEGSYVLRVFDRTDKLHSPWKGPYLVSKVISNRNHVKLLNLLTGAETLCSIVALKPFNLQSTNPDYLSAIAAQARAEHLVQEVQQIDTQRQRALVQWVGASEPTWEPLEEIRKTKAYSDFIKNQKSPKRSSPRKKN